MVSETNFLREKAATLRDMAKRAPAIAAELRRLAGELEAKAAGLERDRDAPGTADGT